MLLHAHTGRNCAAHVYIRGVQLLSLRGVCQQKCVL